MIRLRIAALGITLAIGSGFAVAQNIPSAPVAPVQTAPGRPPVIASPDGGKAGTAKSAAKPAAKKAAGKSKAKKKRSTKPAATAGAPKN